MVVVKESVGGTALSCTYYIDNNLKKELDSLQKFVDHNWDAVGFLVGYEGDGKTTLGMELCYYLDPNFSLTNIVFNPQQFEDAVDNLPHGSSILWDEADDLSSNWASEMMVSIKRKFKRIRSRNMKILLCTPTFHDINKYFAIVRTRFLIHVYANGLQRGHFRFFGRDKKKYLYIKGKKYMDLSAEMSNFYGKFVNIPKVGFPIDLEIYEEKKQIATDHLVAIEKPKDVRIEIYSQFMKWKKDKGLKIPRKEQEVIFNVDMATLQRYDREKRLQATRDGN